MTLKGLYGRTGAAALIGAAVFGALGPNPSAPLSFLAGAAIVTIPFASWHWLLARRRPAWAYLLVVGGKLALFGYVFFGLNGPGVVHGTAFLVGMASVIAGAFCFGIDASRAMTAVESKGAA